MQSVSSSSSSVNEDKESKSVKKMPSKTSAKGTKESSKEGIDVEKSMQELSHGDVNESEQASTAETKNDDESQISMCGEDQTFGRGESAVKDVNEYLKGKVGADISAKKWLEGCEGLDNLEKSEVIIRLVYEVCLAKNIKYDLENGAAENEKENNKDKNFDTRRIFELFKKVNRLLLPQDCRRLIELVCQNGNVALLEKICQQEAADKGHAVKIDRQYPWKGEFTGYETLIELLQYVLNQPCSPKIVLCIAKKVYGTRHNVYNGKKYLEDSQIQSMEKRLNQPSPVMEECLKKAIECGHKEAVSVLLSGDIFNCICLMPDKKFQEEERFLEALNMIEETVADVMSSFAKQTYKQDLLKEVKCLLKDGIAIDIKQMKIKDIIDELEDQGIELSKDDKRKKEKLVEKLVKGGGGKVRLRKTVVGGLISTLFFNYQDELVGVLKDKKSFELKISITDKS